jgi:hypothetical protein
MKSSVDFLRKYSDIIAEAQQPVAAPAAAPAPVDPKVATGAQTVGKTLGAKGSGQMVAKGLGQVSQGKSVTGQMSKAIAPFVEPLEKILADPMLKQKFLALIKQAQ